MLVESALVFKKGHFRNLKQWLMNSCNPCEGDCPTVANGLCIYAKLSSLPKLKYGEYRCIINISPSIAEAIAYWIDRVGCGIPHTLIWHSQENKIMIHEWQPFIDESFPFVLPASAFTIPDPE